MLDFILDSRKPYEEESVVTEAPVINHRRSGSSSPHILRRIAHDSPRLLRKVIPGKGINQTGEI